MAQSSKRGEFALFLDESGSPKPNPKDQAPFFAMGGILIDRVDEASVEEKLTYFKHNWGISEDTPLHGSEIRAKKNRFACLGTRSPQEQKRFMEELTETILSCPIVVHACVISRSGYFK